MNALRAQPGHGVSPSTSGAPLRGWLTIALEVPVDAAADSKAKAGKTPDELAVMREGAASPTAIGEVQARLEPATTDVSHSHVLRTIFDAGADAKSLTDGR